MIITYITALKLFGLHNSNNINKDIIKKLYKKLILKYHPDKNNNSLSSKKNTQIINQAYIILINNESESEFSTKEFLINLLEKCIYTGDNDMDNYIKISGENLYNFISKIIINNN